MRFLKIIFVTLIVIFIGEGMNAQCFSFAKNMCKSQLGDFVHDGNYNATVLSEGEKAELFKTFFEGQKYRIVICKTNELPNIHFQVTEQNGKVLFDNKDFNYIHQWDFEIESTQMLIVKMKVLERIPKSSEVLAGCVAVLFGIEKNKK